jgi:GNAT superfamily N-acetyltransferase
VEVVSTSLTTEIDFMNGESPIVRSAEARDAAAIAALQVRSWRAAYRGIVPDAFLDDLAEDAWLERWTEQLAAARREGVHQLVSTDAPETPPRAVAVCGPAIEPTADLTGQLYVLYADPPSWGRGHGVALLRRVHGLLAGDGHFGALLWVAADNDRSIRFYEHHGWERDGETQREEVAGAVFDEARMVRRLAC